MVDLVPKIGSSINNPYSNTEIPNHESLCESSNTQGLEKLNKTLILKFATEYLMRTLTLSNS